MAKKDLGCLHTRELRKLVDQPTPSSASAGRVSGSTCRDPRPTTGQGRCGDSSLGNRARIDALYLEDLLQP